MVTIRVHETTPPRRPLSGALVTIIKGYTDDPADFFGLGPPVLLRVRTDDHGVATFDLPARPEGAAPLLVWVGDPVASEPPGDPWREARASGHPWVSVASGPDAEAVVEPEAVVELEAVVERPHQPDRRWLAVSAGSAFAAAIIALVATVNTHHADGTRRVPAVPTTAAAASTSASPSSAGSTSAGSTSAGSTSASSTSAGSVSSPASPGAVTGVSLFALAFNPLHAIGTFSDSRGGCPGFPATFSRPFVFTQHGTALRLDQPDAHDTASGTIGPSGSFDVHNDAEDYQGVFTPDKATGRYRATDPRTQCVGTYAFVFSQFRSG